jgi:hypothetical protein
MDDHCVIWGKINGLLKKKGIHIESSQLISKRRDNLIFLCKSARDENLIVKCGHANINWPYLKTNEVQNEIRMFHILNKSVPSITPIITSTFELGDNWYAYVRQYLPFILAELDDNKRFIHITQLFALLELVQSQPLSKEVQRICPLGNVKLEFEYELNRLQNSPWVDKEIYNFLVNQQNTIVVEKSSFSLTLAIGNFTPGNIAIDSQNQLFLIDCSTFIRSCRSYDAIKLTVYEWLRIISRTHEYNNPYLNTLKSLLITRMLDNSISSMTLRAIILRHAMSWMIHQQDTRITVNDLLNLISNLCIN